MSTPKTRITRSKSDDSGFLTLLEKVKDEIVQATQAEIRKESEKIIKKLSSLEGRIDSLEKSFASLTSKQCANEEKIVNLSNQIDEMKQTVGNDLYDEMYQRMRRSKNIIISGVPEHLNGDVKERQNKDLEFVHNLLQVLKVNPSYSEKVTRIGKIKNNSNRLIRVNLDDNEITSEILKNAKSLRSLKEFKDVFVNPDRTPLQQQQFVDLRRQLKARRELGEDVVIFGNKVVSRDSLGKRTQKNFQ
jgi:hypothetical protein